MINNEQNKHNWKYLRYEIYEKQWKWKAREDMKSKNERKHMNVYTEYDETSRLN